MSSIPVSSFFCVFFFWTPLSKNPGSATVRNHDLCALTGPFEKFSQVTLIQTLTGKQFSEKEAENCVAIWKSQGSYTEADAKTIDKFLVIFKDQNFPPGSSILFTISLLGSLTITFSKDGSIPETGDVVIEDGKLGEAILESQIGKHGVSPATKKCLASRLYNLMNQKANYH